jgi:hypothetical protein
MKMRGMKVLENEVVVVLVASSSDRISGKLSGPFLFMDS